MKMMLLILAGSIIRSVGLSGFVVDKTDVELDAETNRALVYLAAQIENLAHGKPSALDPSQLRREGVIFEEPPKTAAADHKSA